MITDTRHMEASNPYGVGSLKIISVEFYPTFSKFTKVFPLDYYNTLIYILKPDKMPSMVLTFVKFRLSFCHTWQNTHPRMADAVALFSVKSNHQIATTTVLEILIKCCVP